MSIALKMESDDYSNGFIEWGGDDLFTHTIVVGPQRCGKTATILKRMVYEVLKAKKRGEKVGLSVIEPKGDLARMVRDMSIKMGLGHELVYIDPLYPDETDRINVMQGDKHDVAEATVAVLKSLFGAQEAFFAVVQELSSRKVTHLLKELYQDDIDIMDVLENLRDEKLLKANVERHRRKFGSTKLISFFDNELLGSGDLANQYRKLIIGLRSHLENLTSNEYLSSILTGKSSIDLDKHLEEGTILAVNTAMGKLGKSGDAFGMFIAMHIQLATFRRGGTESTRVPHYFIADEYARYINPDVERFLSVSPEYRVALIAAIQAFSQLEIESGDIKGKAMKRTILTTIQNKIIFGGFEYEDAGEASKIMGNDLVIERSRVYDGGILKNILPKAYRDEEKDKERFHSSIFMDGLPRFHCVCKLRKNGEAQKPIVAKGEFVPRNWEEEIFTEQYKKVINMPKPPFWKLRERAHYNVEYYEYRNAEKLKNEKRKKLSEMNPFDQLNDDLNVNENKSEKNRYDVKHYPILEEQNADDVGGNQIDSHQLDKDNEVSEGADDKFSFNLVLNRKEHTDNKGDHKVVESKTEDITHIELDLLNENPKHDGQNYEVPENQSERKILANDSTIHENKESIKNPILDNKTSTNDNEENKPHASFWGL